MRPLLGVLALVVVLVGVTVLLTGCPPKAEKAPEATGAQPETEPASAVAPSGDEKTEEATTEAAGEKAGETTEAAGPEKAEEGAEAAEGAKAEGAEAAPEGAPTEKTEQTAPEKTGE